MEQGPQTPRERALVLIKLLVGVEPNWRPTFQDFLWGLRIVITVTVLVIVVALLGGWLWDVLADYVKPKTATQRKDLANIFVLIAAGLVGALTAIAALGNLYISRRNLQNARETLASQQSLEEQRGQGTTLQGYFQQIGNLLLDKERPLHMTRAGENAVSVLAQAQTLSALDSLDASHKRDLILFLYNTRLIDRRHPVLRFDHADLSKADLRGATLRGATLESADLSDADLTGADLSDADLSGAYLRNANLSDANLSDAYLSGTDLSDAYVITNEELEQQARSLAGATMPNDQRYEVWLKAREGRQENGKNGGSS